jgi:hypothetical protein
LFWSLWWGLNKAVNRYVSHKLSNILFLGVTVFLYFEVSGVAAASWNGEGSRCLRRCYGADRSAYIGLNHSDKHMLRAAVLTHYSTVQFCIRSRVYRAVISAYNRKISSIASSRSLEQVVQRVTTTWTTGGRVGYCLPRLSNIVESGIDAGFSPCSIPGDLK